MMCVVLIVFPPHPVPVAYRTVGRTDVLRPVHAGNFVAIFGNNLLPICCRIPQQFVDVFGNNLLPVWTGLYGHSEYGIADLCYDELQSPRQLLHKQKQKQQQQLRVHRI